MNCRSAKRLLAGYLDGAIRPADRIYVREHVSSSSSAANIWSVIGASPFASLMFGQLRLRQILLYAFG